MPVSDDAPPPKRRRKTVKREPPPVDEANLDAAALAYLDRFDATAQKLRAVLMRRVYKRARVEGTDTAEGEQLVRALVDRYRRSGLVDDVRYAASMARGLRDRGGSVRGIRAKLRARGVSDQDVSAALDQGGIAGDEGELAAARTFARKRRIGPYRRSPPEEKTRRREMAAMARAGFGADVCRAVLDTDADDLADD